MSQQIIGRKVFFLYPHRMLEEQILSDLSEKEYEIYTLKDHQRALKIFSEYPDSILFVNIDEQLKEDAWEEYIRKLLAMEETKEIRIGIVSFSDDPGLKQKYLMEIMVPCGFVLLKAGVNKTREIILGALNANEAKGRRKYVRAQCAEDRRVGFNFTYRGEKYAGKIRDISSVGMACIFDGPCPIEKGAKIQQIQLNLRGALVTTDAVALGTQQEQNEILVLLFNPPLIDSMKRKVTHFIQKTLQSRIDALL